MYFDSPQLGDTIKNFRLLIERYNEFLEKDLGLVFPLLTVYDFSRKMLFMLHSIN